MTNNLLTRPDLAAQYHPEGNNGVPAADVVAGTNKMLWWRCPAGPDHRWRAAGKDRLMQGCPFCAGKRASLTSSIAADPVLAVEYFAEDNDGVRADQVVAGTDRKVWWRCVTDPTHRWAASGAARVAGSGCPRCKSSRGERAVAAHLEAVGVVFEREWCAPGLRDKRPLPFDFAVPSLRLLVEFDGEQHRHPVAFDGRHDLAQARFELTVRHDRMKDAWAAENGWRLVRISDLADVASHLDAVLRRQVAPVG